MVGQQSFGLQAGWMGCRQQQCFLHFFRKAKGRTGQLQKLWTMIIGSWMLCKTSVQLCKEEDSIVWTKTASGMYTAKSAYKMQFLGSVGSTFPTKV
jgi:hypothetical protein